MGQLVDDVAAAESTLATVQVTGDQAAMAAAELTLKRAKQHVEDTKENNPHELYIDIDKWLYCENEGVPGKEVMYCLAYAAIASTRMD